MQAAVESVSALSTFWWSASGLNDVAPIVDMAPERFEKVMQGNVTGAWLALPRLRQAGHPAGPRRQGDSRLLGARQARPPGRLQAYCASKAATDGLTKALGCEWGKYGITVNAIAPTVFRSPLTAWMFEDDEKARRDASRDAGAHSARPAG